MDSKIFSTKIIKLRKKQHLTQQEMAHLLDVSQSTYCAWESGACTPNMRHIPSIAKAFCISIQSLFEDDSPGVAVTHK